MGKVIGAKVPVWFRVLAVLGLLWNAYGVYMYLQSVGMIRNLAQVAPAQAVPAWVTGTFAIAVFAGLLGSLLMVVGKRLACPLLVLSLIAVIVQTVWIVFISNARAVEGMKALIMPGAITLVALLLVLVAARGAEKRWLD
jgi:hypothetical protein